ncbi:MAG: TetR/AcrR family transcriptional regulator [Eubacteriales bacterium]|nr:TetR/AcrR family transcriptional regulator [Eubacteriales bacterium]
MKREEKNQKMRRKIMDSALAEFSSQGYGSSSINTICVAQNISKGIVYHYFETKDELYLCCVEECFQHLTAYIRNNISTDECSIEKHLQNYFSTRTRFFKEQPVYQRIFCEAVIAPPEHLKEEIQKRKQDFDTLNTQILRQLLTPASLRSDISVEQIIEIFRQFQDFINIRYQMTDLNDTAFESHEENCLRALNVLLYGVIQRKDEYQNEN